MKVYFDALSDTELFSDAYKIEEVDGVMYKVKSKWVIKTEGGDYVEKKEGENVEGTRVNEIEDKFGLISTTFKKKDYVAALKVYIGKVQKYLKDNNKTEELKVFKKGGNAFVKKIVAEFKEWEFFFTTAIDEGMVVLQKYGEDQTTPYLYFWKHGVLGKSY